MSSSSSSSSNFLLSPCPLLTKHYKTVYPLIFKAEMIIMKYKDKLNITALSENSLIHIILWPLPE
jgi:hypothetical protein